MTELECEISSLVKSGYAEVGLHDTVLIDYVVNVLKHFVSVESMCLMIDNKPLYSVAEMIEAADPLYGGHGRFGRERTIRQLIGDVALFRCGLFPESLTASRRKRALLLGANYCADTFVDYMAVGKESYRIVAAYDRTESSMPYGPKTNWLLFYELANEFERCVKGLSRFFFHSQKL